MKTPRLAVFRGDGYSIEAKDCSIRTNLHCIKVYDCLIRVRDCSIRVYRFFTVLCLPCFSDVSNNFWISVQEKSCNLLSIIPRNHPIILEYSPNLFEQNWIHVLWDQTQICCLLIDNCFCLFFAARWMHWCKEKTGNSCGTILSKPHRQTVVNQLSCRFNSRPSQAFFCQILDLFRALLI